MKNEDRIETERQNRNRPIIRRLVPRPDRERLRHITIGIIVVAIFAGCIYGFIYGLMLASCQQVYNIDFCNISQSEVDSLMNGSESLKVQCIQKREWQGVVTLSFKSRGSYDNIVKLINENNISCWK